MDDEDAGDALRRLLRSYVHHQASLFLMQCAAWHHLAEMEQVREGPRAQAPDPAEGGSPSHSAATTARGPQTVLGDSNRSVPSLAKLLGSGSRSRTNGTLVLDIADVVSKTPKAKLKAKSRGEVSASSSKDVAVRVGRGRRGAPVPQRLHNYDDSELEVAISGTAGGKNGKGGKLGSAPWTGLHKAPGKAGAAQAATGKGGDHYVHKAAAAASHPATVAVTVKGGGRGDPKGQASGALQKISSALQGLGAGRTPPVQIVPPSPRPVQSHPDHAAAEGAAQSRSRWLTDWQTRLNAASAAS